MIPSATNVETTKAAKNAKVGSVHPSFASFASFVVTSIGGLTHQTAGLTTAMAHRMPTERMEHLRRRSLFGLRQPAAAFGVAACCPPRGALRHPQQAAASAKRQQAAAVQGASAPSNAAALLDRVFVLM